ncbi:MAG TPA: hypothetical protein VEX68_05560 [Bryobacteraceae bacterium]|nr:hypothetical protein [Bryobacteraceae bacterium]
MLRGILYLIISLALIAFLRMVMGMIFTAMKEMAAPGTPAPDQPRKGAVPVSGELKRDPVCGTFVPITTSFQKTVKGEAFHFCSANCRDKYGA